ncbi:IucA/IucC family protein [Aliikangiella maris]|uniref:IucA/IucC family protein n=2 Tax=Aliikangiella maris TaxID=3162458 RepID=A0ABV3MLB2_9GAMM
MIAQSTSQYYQQSLIKEKAAQRSISGLLNCYCREFASLRGEVQINPQFGVTDWPQAIKYGNRNKHEHLMLITLTKSRAWILVRIADLKKLGQCRYLSAPYLKSQGSGWQRLNYQELSSVLLQNLALELNQPFNHELLTQIENSVANSCLFLTYPANGAPDRLQYDGFIRSEQSLIWGHAWHPTPKSREGIDDTMLLSISPESGAKFKLPLLAVHNTLLKVLNCEGYEPLVALRKLTTQNIPAEFQVLPCHPYQLARFQSTALFKAALALGKIKWLGESQIDWFPTSSVRTLYAPETDYFLKFSLHIRLTNCVRKNAWYELESAIFITELIRKFNAQVKQFFPAFELMEEPASVTIDLSHLSIQQSLNNQAEQINQLSEAFGLLFRSAYTQNEVNQFQPRVAAALFADDENFSSVALSGIQALATHQSLSYIDACHLWFEHYLKNLLPPVFYYFFKLGIIFEPHLQNTVIGFTEHLPSRIQLRDLEGTKLVAEKWSEADLAELSDRARESVIYCREQGYRRIAYCTLINNISEAIHYLSGSNWQLENQLWLMVRQQIIQYQNDFGHEPELEALVDGDDIPCKCNLMTRLLKQADRQAEYIYLSNPMREL